MKWLRGVGLAVLPPVAGVLVATLIASLIVLAVGRSPGAVAARFWSEFLPTDWGFVIFWATVYSLTGLAVAHAFRAGLFNIGGEGQLLAGGFVLGLAGAALPSGMPWLAAVPLCIAACFAGGAAWAAVPAVLRARLGVHEVIATILMNLVAPPLLNFLLNQYRKSHPELAEKLRTEKVAEGARIPLLDAALPRVFGAEGLLDLEGSDASLAVLLALGAAVLAWFHVNRTRGGFELRAVGHNAEAAHASGVRVPAVIVKALLVSGGLAALGSVPYVLGSKHYFEQGMLAGAGFTGIAVAVLAGNDPLRVLVAATLLGFLTQAGQVVNGSGPDQVRKEIVQVLQALVIVSVLVAQGTARRLIAAREARRATRAE